MLLRLPNDSLQLVCMGCGSTSMLRLLHVHSSLRRRLRGCPIDLSPDCFEDRYLSLTQLHAAGVSTLHWLTVTGIGICPPPIQVDSDDPDGEANDLLWSPEGQWKIAQPLYATGAQLLGATLRTLDLTDFPGPTLDCFRPCTALRVLGVYGSALTDISALRCFKELATLTLQEAAQVMDLTPLAACRSLRVLCIEQDGFCSGACAGRDLSFLHSCSSECSSLEELSLRNWSYLSDISALAKCPLLQVLEIPNSAVADLEGLAESCSELRVLNLFGCRNVVDVSALANLGGLQELDLTEGAAVVTGLEWALTKLDLQLYGLVLNSFVL